MSELLQRPLLVVDTETTGVEPATAQVWELGMVYVDGGEIREERQWLVNPGAPIPAEVVELTGLTQEDLVAVAGAPPWSAVAPAVAAQVQSWAPWAVCGYNLAEYDAPLLLCEAARHGTVQVLGTAPGLDVRVVVRRFLRHLRQRTLSAIYEHLQLPAVGAAHRAVADCRMTWAILRHFAEQLPTTIAKLLVWYEAEAERQAGDWRRFSYWMYTNPDTGQLHLGCGKHCGVVLAEVNRGYLRWVLQQSATAWDDPLPEVVVEAFRRALDEQPTRVTPSEGDAMPVFQLEGMAEAAEILPEGEYIAKVSAVTVKENKHKLPVLAIKYVVAKGKAEGQTFFDNLNVPTKEAPAIAGVDNVTTWKRMLVRFLVAVGAKDLNKINTDEWIGRVVKIRLRHDSSYDGEPRLKVQGVKPA